MIWQYDSQIDSFFKGLGDGDIPNKILRWLWYQKWCVRAAGLLSFILLLLILIGYCLDDQLADPVQNDYDGDYIPRDAYNPMDPKWRSSKRSSKYEGAVYSQGFNQNAKSVRYVQLLI